MSQVACKPRYSVAEEIAHAVTHGLGAALSIAALAVLVAFSTLYGDAWHITSSSIYGATLILCYLASTLYHAMPLETAKRWLQRFDHAAIFLLIAGTYTPFALVNLRGPWGWSLLGVVWTLAIAGVVLEFLPKGRLRRLSLVMYLGMGWLVVVAIKPLIDAVEPGGLLLLLLGGLSYSLGVIFYVWRRLTFHHAIWHLFVLLGSGLHFFSVLFYVIPGAEA